MVSTCPVRLQRVLLAIVCVLGGVVTREAAAQVPQAPPASPVERLGPTSYRIGTVQVDTAKREVSVRGTVNMVTTLEFIAATKKGYKNYESAIELDTTAINLNVGLLLIGLDPARSVPPSRHLDPAAPKGDPVDIFVEWGEGDQHRRIKAEELVYDDVEKKTMSEGPFVYTGSVFSKANNGYLADVEGSLIGFVHSPAPVIDSPRVSARGPYGARKFNMELGLAPGTSVLLTVKALPLGN